MEIFKAHLSDMKTTRVFEESSYIIKPLPVNKFSLNVCRFDGSEDVVFFFLGLGLNLLEFCWLVL